MLNSLKVKIIGLTTVILLMAVVVTGWLNLRTQHSILERYTEQNGRILGETIRNSVIANMAAGKNSEVANILARISKEPAIERVRIFDETGRILISANAEETGDLIEASEILAYRSNRFSYDTELNGIEMHTTMVPIHNAPVCHRCHDPKASVLGILNVHLSKEEMVQLQNKGRQATLMSSAGMLVVMTLVLTLFILLYVDQPLRKFAAAMHLVEDGKFDLAHTDIHNSREMALMSNKFNLMVKRLQELMDRTIHQQREMAIADEKLAHHDEIRNMNITLEERLKEIEYLNITLEERIEEIEEANFKIADLAGELEDRNAGLERAVERLQALNEMGMAMNSTVNLERLFSQLIRRATESLQAHIGYILLLDRASWSLKIGAAVGLEDRPDEFQTIPIKPGGVSNWVIKNQQPLLITNMDENREFSRVSRLGFTRETVICAPLLNQDEMIGTITIANRRDQSPFDTEDLELLTTIAAQASIAIRNARLYEEQETTYLGTVQALVSAVEASDAYTKGHSERVRRYAMNLAVYLDLPVESLKNLEQAAILHDIGKIGINETLLHKPGKLTDEEFQVLQQHPSIGSKILGPISFLGQVREIISQHHERHDGKGYPNRLNGEEMLLEARILSVVDTYDAMTTDRPYRKALSHEVTIQEIKDHSGTQFDPTVAAAFIEMCENTPLRDSA